MYRKLKSCFLPLLLVTALLFPAGARAAAPAIPAFEGAAAVELNYNIPSFPADSPAQEDYVNYAPLDALGRVGVMTACLSRASLPSGLRADDVRALPVGWVTTRYDDLIEGGYLYKLCRLLSPALGGDASAPENVFTGTAFLRDEGMRPYEDLIAGCLARTANHVLYRVTPLFEGGDPVPAGLQLEARSVEDGGRSLSFNVFVYNIQPGVDIDYGSGQSMPDASITLSSSAADLIRSRCFPVPADTLAPQHASFDALYEDYANGSGQSAQSQTAPAISSQSGTTPAENHKPQTQSPPAASTAAGAAAQAVSPTPQPTAAPSQDSGLTLGGLLSNILSPDSGKPLEGNTMVWLSSNGKLYHRIENCSNMDPLYAYQKTVDWCELNGYTPCDKCWK